MKRKISLGFSPCPNDTFMLGAIVNNMVDTGEIYFEPVIDDVEKLNRKALNAEVDVTKLSVAAYAFASQNYLVLNSGSALGKNCGPILITKNKSGPDENSKIAIPGKYTTANLLLSFFYPEFKNKDEIIFSGIEDALLNEKYDAGVIIHENRFTYEKRGLQKIVDLGELWEQSTGSHVPLGCIGVKKSLDRNTAMGIDGLINESIRFALAHPEKILPYVKKYAQEMNDDVIYQHINLYVNEFSLALGARGKKAIELLLQKGAETGILPSIEKPFFVS